jgi:F-box interacting protein
MAEGGAAALSLSGDSIFDILSWTPVKSVCRFRCVSKEWLALISDPVFIAKHKSRAAPEPRLVISFSEAKYASTDSGLLVTDMKGNVVRAIRGLGRFPTVHSNLDYLVSVSSYDCATRVVDVVTGKVLFTCPPPRTGLRETVVLGRAAVSSSCKVVRLTQHPVSEYGGKVTETCEVLTLEEDGVECEWRQAEPPPALVSVCSFGSSCLSAAVNGIVHFLSSSIHGAPADRVLCFNLESEEWTKAIDGPLNADTESWRKTGKIRLAKFKDALCMIQTEVRQTNRIYANIWLLVNPGSSIWVKTYVIPMASSSDGVQPLWVMPDGVRLLLFYYSMEKCPVRVYDPCTGKCTEVMEMPKCVFGGIALCNLHLDRLICGVVRSS